MTDYDQFRAEAIEFLDSPDLTEDAMVELGRRHLSPDLPHLEGVTANRLRLASSWMRLGNRQRAVESLDAATRGHQRDRTIWRAMLAFLMLLATILAAGILADILASV